MRNVPSPQVPLPLYSPYLGPEVHAAASHALSEGWLALGPLTRQFESELAAYLELDASRPLVSTSSCTAALHLAALVAGAGPGDEVICPAFTYVADHQAITQTGADVVLCDIEERTLGADPASIEALITERTKAVVVVHYAGIPCDIEAILEIGRRRGIRVIEDAAHALGTRLNGRPIGSFGDMACFSFGPVKMITSLEGGCVITPDPADKEVLEQLRLLGVTADTAARYEKGRAWDYDVVRQGFRYHLGSVQASIGLSQLAMIDTFTENRRQYCQQYNEGLAGIPGVVVPATDFAEVGAYIYVIRVDGAATREALMAHLKADGIGSGIHYFGAQDYTYYRGARKGDLSVTERVSDQVVSLPLHGIMDDGAVERVVASIRSFFCGR